MASICTGGDLVEGNYVGTNVNGGPLLGLGTAGNGIRTSWADSNTIGGLAKGAGNVISGNGLAGVLIDNASSNLVQGNRLGTNTSGSHNVGNASDGVEIYGGSSDNTIGGLATGAANIIADNGGSGVGVVNAVAWDGACRARSTTPSSLIQSTATPSWASTWATTA